MADRNAGAAGRAPQADHPDAIRNVVLVGHTGAGKTTLLEALLVATGTIGRPGRVEYGTTISDFDDAELRLQHSVSLALAPVVSNGIKVNLLDTPGYADFVGEVRAGLRAADCALFVVSATDGIDGATRLLWDECAAVSMPRAVVITKIDHPRADFEATLAAVQDAFGETALPLYLPASDAGSTAAVTNLLTVRDHPGHGPLIEGVIQESEDESLMDRYLAGEDISLAVLIADLERAVAHATFHPVLPVESTTGVGVAELLDLVTSGFPAPSEHPMPEITALDGTVRGGLTCDPQGPLVAEVVKTTTDPYVGRISLVRLFSGTLGLDAAVHVSGHLHGNGHQEHDEDERVGPLSIPLGKSLRPVTHAVAGDIVAVAKLGRAETGDTLSDKDDPLVMRPWTMPDPLLPVAVQAHSKADEDKVAVGLQRLFAEDPSLRVENNSETHQQVLWTMGESHADLLLQRLRTRFGVQVDQVPLRVPLRETLAGAATGRGRHVKQSGGHGQFAICDIRVEPLTGSLGFEFVDKVVGGAVPRAFIPSVEKGVQAQMGKGVTSGYPMVGVRVTLVDGKAHSVDSSDMAFQMAGGLALRDAAEKAGVTLLEPVDEVAILIPDEHLGSVMSDLSGRRGHVLGTEAVGDGSSGQSIVRAEVPQTEMIRYPIELRALTQGTGTFSREFRGYEPVPVHLATSLLKPC